MRGDRSGSALILVLMMTLAVAGLSIAAIFMSSSAGLLSAFYDREREYRLATEAGLEMVRSRLSQDSTIAIPDTGFIQLLAGMQVRDASGTVLTRVSVNVYAAMTGDTTGGKLPFVTLIGSAYDTRGTRHVRRMDLRRESFAHYSLFVDSFPSSLTHGPGIVQGRAHTNGTWRGIGTGNTYRDTVTALVAVTAASGAAVFDVDSIVGVPRVVYPRDSTFLRLDTLAAAANLSFAPVSGSGRGSRLQFVALDADNDGTVEESEGFVKVFDLASAFDVDTMRLRVSPADSAARPSIMSFTSVNYYHWTSPIVQNQCGAFYHVGTRWHFFPIAAHRAPYVNFTLTAGGPSRYPLVNPSRMNAIDDYNYSSVDSILSMPTARCFPAGSPYLMPSERMTNESGVVTGTAADTIPWGVVTPPGGWPANAPNGYGGSDSTFTVRSRTCTIASGGSVTGRCDTGTLRDLGSWRTFAGSAPTVSTSVRQAIEAPYLWPITAPANPTARGVVTASSGPLYVSGTVRGAVTLKVNGRITIVDRLEYATEPNDPTTEACTNRLGLLAVGDILVVDGLTTRVPIFATVAYFVGPYFVDSLSRKFADRAMKVHANAMSLTGTVGVENPTTYRGATSAQLRCPEGAASTTASNGGCLLQTGAAVMKTYSQLYSGSYSGFRYGQLLDRCQNSTKRPPFFPLTNRYTFVRTLEIEPSRANTPAKIRTLLMRLKGKAL